MLGGPALPLRRLEAQDGRLDARRVGRREPAKGVGSIWMLCRPSFIDLFQMMPKVSQVVLDEKAQRDRLVCPDSAGHTQ